MVHKITIEFDLDDGVDPTRLFEEMRGRLSEYIEGTWGLGADGGYEGPYVYDVALEESGPSYCILRGNEVKDTGAVDYVIYLDFLDINMSLWVGTRAEAVFIEQALDTYRQLSACGLEYEKGQVREFLTRYASDNPEVRRLFNTDAEV